MKLENQVVSLELAKKLKELGVKQGSLFWWVKGKMDYGYEGEWSIGKSDSWFLFDHIVNCKIDGSDLQLDIKTWEDESDEEFIKWERRRKRAENKFLKENIVSAFTVAELGELLYEAINFDYPGEKDWRCGYPYTYKRSDEKWWCIVRPYPKGFVGNLDIEESTESKTEADARAKMLIYLLENNIINSKLKK